MLRSKGKERERGWKKLKGAGGHCFVVHVLFEGKRRGFVDWMLYIIL